MLVCSMNTNVKSANTARVLLVFTKSDKLLKLPTKGVIIAILPKNVQNTVLSSGSIKLSD